MTMTKQYNKIAKLKGDSVKSVTTKQVNPNVSPSVEDVKTADGDHNLSFSIPRAQRISGMTVTNGDQNNVTMSDDSNGDAVIAMTLKSSSDVNVISPTHVQTAANSSNNDSIAIGDSASAIGDSSISIGKTASAQGINDIAISSGASTSDSQHRLSKGSIATTETNDVGRVALGCHSVADREFEVSVGNKARGIYRNITNALPPVFESDVATKTYADNVAYGARILLPFSDDFKQIESSLYSPTCMPTCHVNTDESTRFLYPYKVKLDKVSTEPFAACLMLPPVKQIANMQVQIKTGTHLTIPNGTKIAIKIYGIDPTTLQPVEGVSYEEDFEFAGNEANELRAIITKSRYVNLYPAAISISFKTTDGIVLNDATADYDMLLNLFSISLYSGFVNFTMTLTKEVTVPAKKTYLIDDFSIESDSIGVVPIFFYQPIGIVDIDVEKMTVLQFENGSLAISNFSDVPVTLNAGTKRKVVLYGPGTPFDTTIE